MNSDKKASAKSTLKNLYDSSTDKMKERFQSLRSELEEQVSQYYSKLGMTKEEALKYIENPANFTPAQWENLQKERRDLIEKYINIEEKPSKKKSSSSLRQNLNKRSGRRNWIPMD